MFVQICASRFTENRYGTKINKDNNHIKFGFSDSYGFTTYSYAKAIEELCIKGFIRIVSQGGFPNKKPVYSISNKWKYLNDRLVNCGEMPENDSGIVPDDADDTEYDDEEPIYD